MRAAFVPVDAIYRQGSWCKLAGGAELSFAARIVPDNSI